MPLSPLALPNLTRPVSHLQGLGPTYHLSHHNQSRAGITGEVPKEIRTLLGLWTLRLMFQAIDGSKRYKTSLIGSHIKTTHLDQTNGKVTTCPRSMQGIFWDKLQLQDQFTRIFLLDTASRRIFYSTHDELCEHVLFMGHKELKTFLFQGMTHDFNPVIRYDLEFLC